MVEIIQFSLIIILMLSVLFIVINMPKRALQIQCTDKTDVLSYREQKMHDHFY